MNEKPITIRALIADDHPVTRAGLRQILTATPDIEVVGEAENAQQIEQLVTELQPDILLLDLVMPATRPYEVEEWVRTYHPRTKTLILTGHSRDYFLAQAVEKGVAGFLQKSDRPEQLIAAIRRAVSGDCLISDEQIARADRWRQEVGRRWSALTPREYDVLACLAKGMDNNLIAESLSITPKTAENHTISIFRKLGVTSRVEVLTWLHTHIPDDWLDFEAPS